MMKKIFIVGAIITTAIIIIEIGIVVGVYLSLLNSGEQDLQNRLDRRILSHKSVLTEDIRQFVYIVYIGDSFTNVIPYPNITLQKFIDLFQIQHSAAALVHNEFKFVPIIEDANRVPFEQLMNLNIKPNFQISDFSSSFQLIPSANRNRYCPLTWIAPNGTVELYPFIGTDLCNVGSWKTLIDQMDQNSQLLYANDRFIAREQEYVFDIGKSVPISQNPIQIAGYSIISFFLSPVITKTLDNVYGLDLAKVKIEYKRPDETKEIIFESSEYNITSNKFSTNILYTYIDNNNTVFEWNIQYKYTDELLDILSGDTAVIILIVIIMIFLIIDVVLLSIVLIYYRKKSSAQNKKLQTENIYIAGMVNYVNHEIRNPLNGIMGLLDITKISLEKQKSTIIDYEVLVSNIDTAYKSGLLIRHIVNDVLDVRRLEEGKLQLYPTDIDMPDFVEDFNKLIQQKSQENVHITFTINNNVNTLNCDKNRLMQILLNIVINAFKFTIQGEIILNISAKGDLVRFECIDTGIGIPENKKDNIFKRFVQIGKNDQMDNVTYSRSGFGLGLYLCQMLCEIMQGDIGFESTNGQGSTFWMELPVLFKQDSVDDDELV